MCNEDEEEEESAQMTAGTGSLVVVVVWCEGTLTRHGVSVVGLKLLRLQQWVQVFNGHHRQPVS